MEIVGLAGTGKTTTCNRLRTAHPDILPVYRVARRRLPAAALRALWFLFVQADRISLRDPSGGFTGLHLLIHMDAMVRDLDARARCGSGMLVLDQGPLFNSILAERMAARGEIDASIARRIRDLFVQNTDFLSAIAVLNADESILLSRIDERESAHQIKGATTSAANQFLEDYRERYESIIRELQGRAGIPVVRIDTGRLGADEVANEIYAFASESESRRGDSECR